MPQLTDLVRIIELAAGLSDSCAREILTEGESADLLVRLATIETRIGTLLGKGGASTNLDDEMRALASACPSPTIILDVGSNIGKWSAMALERFPEAHIYAYEPQSEPFTAVQRIAETSGGRCTVFNKAVSNSIGRAPLYAEEAGSSWGSLHKRDLSNVGYAFEIVEEVETTTIEAEFQALALTHVDILKLDVEGHELAALKGAEGVLSKVRCVQFEFGGTMLDSRTFLKDLYDIFDRHGFRVGRITALGLLDLGVYDTRHECFDYMNCLAINRDFSMP